MWHMNSDTAYTYLYAVYLTTLSAAQGVIESNFGMINKQLIWTDTERMSGRPERNHDRTVGLWTQIWPPSPQMKEC
jgi:hypothetical protein